MPEKLHNKLEFHYEIVRSTRDPAKEPPPESLKLSPDSDFEHLNKVVKAIDECLRDVPNDWETIELGPVFNDAPKPKGLTLCEVFTNEAERKINPEWEKATYRQLPKSSPFEMTQYVKHAQEMEPKS